MTKHLLAAVIALLIYVSISAQQTSPAIQRIDPSNWWIGMKNPNLQLLVYEPKAGTFNYAVSYPGVKLVKANKVENSNYA